MHFRLISDDPICAKTSSSIPEWNAEIQSIKQIAISNYSAHINWARTNVWWYVVLVRQTFIWSNSLTPDEEWEDEMNTCEPSATLLQPPRCKHTTQAARQKIHLSDFIPNEQVRQQCRQPPVSCTICKQCLGWFDHATRFPPSISANQVLHLPPAGWRRRERPKMGLPQKVNRDISQLLESRAQGCQR